MTPENTPPPGRFQRFERVVFGSSGLSADLAGRSGSILWCDPPWKNRRTGVWSEWIYCVHLDHPGGYRSVVESALKSTGAFDSPERHRGVGYEISFDDVLKADACHVEGSFRTPGRFWGIFGIGNDTTDALTIKVATWPNGIDWVSIGVPPATPIDEALILRAMTDVYPGGSWSVIPGPDSMTLR